ncbi:MAG: hypothetical protein AB1485_03995 [Candidatus Thermoplasmatota archaeon]
MKNILTEFVGRRCLIVHDEGNPKGSHTVVGTICSATKDVLVLTTDRGIKTLIPTKQILKIKELKETYVGGDLNGE